MCCVRAAERTRKGKVLRRGCLEERLPRREAV
jgi:hypothetical protein